MCRIRVLQLSPVLPLALVLLPARPASGQEEGGDDPARVCVRVLRNKQVSLDYRRRACNELAALGPKAAAAIPALIEVLPEEDVGCWAACALKAIGPQARAAVVKLLARTDKSHVRLRLTAELALAKR